MSKFVSCVDGCYVNVAQISEFRLNHQSYNRYSVRIIYNDFENGTGANLIAGLTKEEAQDWLDKFMTTNGLCIEPTATNRRF